MAGGSRSPKPGESPGFCEPAEARGRARIWKVCGKHVAPRGNRAILAISFAEVGEGVAKWEEVGENPTVSVDSGTDLQPRKALGAKDGSPFLPP